MLLLVKDSHGLHFPMASPLTRTPHTPHVVFELFSVNFLRKKVTVSLHKVNARKPDRVMKTLAVKNLFRNSAEKACGVSGSLFAIKTHAFQEQIDLFHQLALSTMSWTSAILATTRPATTRTGRTDRYQTILRNRRDLHHLNHWNVVNVGPGKEKQRLKLVIHQHVWVGTQTWNPTDKIETSPYPLSLDITTPRQMPDQFEVMDPKTDH